MPERVRSCTTSFALSDVADKSASPDTASSCRPRESPDGWICVTPGGAGAGVEAAGAGAAGEGTDGVGAARAGRIDREDGGVDTTAGRRVGVDGR